VTHDRTILEYGRVDKCPGFLGLLAVESEIEKCELTLTSSELLRNALALPATVLFWL
jgi:hypothetical protein